MRPPEYLVADIDIGDLDISKRGEELWGQAYTFDKVECVHSGMQKGGLESRKGKKFRQNL
jgi:hypothetical protein